MKATLAIGVFIILFSTGAAHAGDASSISFTATQMGVPVTAEFKRFDAKISFDPNDLKKSGAAIKIHVDSVDAGNHEATKEIRRKTWLDAMGHPFAVFESRSVTAMKGNRYMVSGRLAIKGRTRDVSAPFMVRRMNGQWLFEGSLAIKRLEFNVGEGVWSDTDTVDDEVKIVFRLFSPASNAEKQQKQGRME
jgi:polyisoprenoid-binding protein YceI